VPSEQWYTIVSAVGSVFAIVGVGVAVRRVGWLTEEADQSLLKLIMRVLLPCLIFAAVSDNPALRETRNLTLSPLVGFGTCVLGFAVAMLLVGMGRSRHGLEDAQQRRTFAVCVGIYNYGFLPLPLIKSLFDDQTLGVLFVHNIGVNLAIWSLGVMLLSGRLDKHWWRQMFNAPMIAIVAALVVNFLGANQYLPLFVGKTIAWLGDATIPLAMILIGATMADLLSAGGNHSGTSDRVKVIGWACLLRLGLLPVAFLLIAYLLPCTVELRRVIVIQAAMPAAVLPIVVSRHYGGDPATALKVVLSTSILGLVTIPLWIAAGMAWLEL